MKSDWARHLRADVLLALGRGDVGEVRKLLREDSAVNPVSSTSHDGAQVQDVTTWLDEWLIAAVRRDPPDLEALDALVERYWKPLFARCHMLTLDAQQAGDLAQEAWCRLLRVRRSLKPDGNFPAYIATIATNLWRDSNRSARRAGPLAEHRMVSLDAALAGEESDAVALVDVLPDLNALQNEEQLRLKLDIDAALEQLPPLPREVVVARYVAGESAADIGKRYGRTEQTVTGWLRQALRQMKARLEDADFVAEGEART